MPFLPLIAGNSAHRSGQHRPGRTASGSGYCQQFLPCLLCDRKTSFADMAGPEIGRPESATSSFSVSPLSLVAFRATRPILTSAAKFARESRMSSLPVTDSVDLILPSTRTNRPAATESLPAIRQRCQAGGGRLRAQAGRYIQHIQPPVVARGAFHRAACAFSLGHQPARAFLPPFAAPPRLPRLPGSACYPDHRAGALMVGIKIEIPPPARFHFA